MSIMLKLTPDMEAKLRERAAAEGKDPATLALEAVAEKLATPEFPNDKNVQQRLNAWNRFIAAMDEHGRQLPPGHTVDDSRDSIYEGRGA